MGTNDYWYGTDADGNDIFVICHTRDGTYTWGLVNHHLPSAIVLNQLVKKRPEDATEEEISLAFLAECRTQ